MQCIKSWREFFNPFLLGPSQMMLNIQLHLRTLHSFLILAEELNFSRAAQRLNIAQPALSQQIKLLEDKLGAVLFERAERPLRLTEAGHYFRVEVQQFIVDLDQAAQTAKQIGEGKKGWLGIGFTRSSMYSILPKVLSSFSKSFPDIELKLYELLTEHQPEALRDRRIHIGIARDPLAEHDLSIDVLIEEELVVALPAEHRLATKKVISLEDLAPDSFILFPKDAKARFPELVLSTCAAVGFSPRVAFRASEIQTALGLVAAGLGVTMVAASVAADTRADLIYRRIKAGAITPTSSLVALYRNGDESAQLAAIRNLLFKEAKAFHAKHGRTR
jgi:LysR family transcriptional regulator, benzoate and cis,cis-muconate-responsive activator of ben and cat genes